jgi:apolipoprotein N-acyltransferase
MNFLQKANMKSISENKLKLNLISLILGLLLTLSFAPYYFIFTAFLAISGFFLILENSEKRKDIIINSFLFGFGHFLTSTYWIKNSLLVDAQSFAWLIPFAISLIPSYLAIFIVLLAISYKFIIRKFCVSENYQKFIIFANLWLFYEVLRSYLFTGFPWNLIGYIWLFNEKLVQIASIFSVYGLGFLAILILLSPVIFIKKHFHNDPKISDSKISIYDKIFLIVILLIIAFSWIFAKYHFSKNPLQIQDISLKIVQANIKQDLKWDPYKKYHNFLKHIKLSKENENSNKIDSDIIIWSETSIPYALSEDRNDLLNELSKVTKKEKYLISGALKAKSDDEGNLENIWNSLFLLSENKIVNSYNKHHLVPFGEYVPLQNYLPFIQKITGGGVGFSKGEGAKTIEIENKFSFSPIICYEVIFSDKIIDRNNRPNLFINITNDSWFGNSSGPYQHFDMTRMRSIEYGIPLVRAANSGISAYIDPFGKVVEKIGLNKAGVLNVKLIKEISPTLYFKYGFLPLLFLVLTSLVFLYKLPKNSQNQKSKKF